MNYDTPEYRAYAQLLVRQGINLKNGQKVLISTGPGVYDFARLVAEACYQAGAAFVNIAVNDAFLSKVRAEYAEDSTLDYFPRFFQAEYEYYTYTDWARIALDDQEDMNLLAGVDSSILGRFRKARMTALSKYREAQMADRFAWTVAAVPGPNWAKRLGVSVEHLWDVLKPIVRLDRADPGLAWQDQNQILRTRCQRLNALGLKSLHFTGPGTDLTVGLTSRARWIGGGATDPDGRPFMPNLPTEEVFTTPDFRLTSGTARVTRPVEVLGMLVEGAWFRFEHGVVVESGADKGADHLAKFLAVDEGASRLGEIALVGEDSPIARSGLLFGSILLDENASCHMALGGGYPTALTGSDKLGSEAERLAAGCNVSLVHTDFMIGGPGVSVTGLTADGQTVPLLADGQWTAELAR